jgi:hypothetical protein
MNIIQRSSAMLVLLLTTVGAPMAWAGEIPSVLWSQHDTTKAAWVAADRAVIGGKIDWALFDDLHSAVLRGAIEHNKGKDCIYMKTLLIDFVRLSGGSGGNTLKDLARNSYAGFSGTVTGSAVGFADGTPATLLQVKVNKALKTSSQFSITNTERLLYIAYPVAEFQVEGLRFCKSDELFSMDIPRIGDKVLAFPTMGPLNEDLNMIYPYDQEIIVQKAGGDLSVPPKWRKDPTITKASTLGEVESMLKADLTPAANASPQKEEK